MSRCLLHKNKLDDFKLWLDKKHIPHRPGRGEFQVLQVALPDGQWGVVYDRIVAPEHYTVTAPMEYIVQRFVQARREKGRAIERKVRGSEMSEKSEALRLADLLEKMPLGECDHQAAAELRRLSKVEAQRDALLKALIGCRDRFFPVDQPKRDRDLMWEPVNAAIKAVEEGK